MRKLLWLLFFPLVAQAGSQPAGLRLDDAGGLAL